MRKENQINLSILKMQSLTDANGRQHPDSRIWWVALWEERLDRVDGEGERHDGLTTMHSTQRRMKAKNLPNVIMMYA